MNDVIEQANYWISQAFIYIPAILTFITAVGLPCIVAVCKVVANTQIWLSQAKTFLGKINALVKCVNALNKQVTNLTNALIQSKLSEIEFLKSQILVTYNKKQQECFKQRIAILEKDIDAICNNHGIENVDELNDAELDNPKKRLKVKVKKEQE